MSIKFKNAAVSVLTGSLTTLSTDILINAADDGKFPVIAAIGADYFYLTLEDKDHNIEIVKIVRHVSGSNNLETDGTADSGVNRGLDGTTARAWNIGDVVELRPNAKALEDIIAALEDPEIVALAGLVSAADKLAYFTGSGTASLADLTAVARTLIAQTTQALMRTTGLGAGTTGSDLFTAATAAAARTTLDVPGLAANNTHTGTNQAINSGNKFSGEMRENKTVTTFNSASPITYTAASMLGGIILRTGVTAPLTDVWDSAANIVAALTSPYVGMSFEFYLKNKTAHNILMLASSGVTLDDGSTVLTAQDTMHFIGVITNVGTPAITLYEISNRL